MRAMVVDDWGTPDALRVEEGPDPEPGPGEVHVRVRAIGVNFMDVLIIAGKYQRRPELPFAPGGEVSGEVVAVGEGVERVRPGDRVVAALPYGGYATDVVAGAERVFPIPDAMRFEEAAATIVAYHTAWFGLVERADLRRGETLLVHAAAGGVGIAAVQIGQALGAHVIGTAGGDAKCRLALENGAAHAIDYRKDDFVPRVEDLTGGRGADVIYDPVGGDVFDRSLKCIAFRGRAVVIGFASGEIPRLKLNRVLLKNIAVTGLHWGAYFEHDPERVHGAMSALWRLWERGQVRPLATETRPLEEAAAALDALAGRRTTGKVVLVP